ncbi:DUF2066 domain-containing protein [Nitratireductor thuwali]|uniref:DUF2066 domain-containing protein n=1 Tax=Nitratireductor thuwali TaxID=2267699 RepID=A0ABY5MH16_9HYPH|nr:hypothetical protein NTH_01777 [Nitratireductor thuwali]
MRLFRPLCLRGLLAALFLLCASATGPTSDNPASLYQAVAIVTGTVEPERSRGFAAALEEVLVKVSGDISLAGSSSLAELADKAGDFASSYHYRDRMAGIPVHDEQGTRERPHFLTVNFAPEKIDAVLRGLGREPWTERPVVWLRVEVDNGISSFLLAHDAAFGQGQRAALMEVAKRYGLPIRLPDGVSAAEPMLAGHLTWRPETLDWSSRWRLAAEGKTREWEISATSFDAVFRAALGETVSLLAGRKRK